MPMFEFQIVSDTAKEAQQFMTAVQANDVNIEEWEYDVGTSTEKQECYGFGVTHYSPKQLQRFADEMGVVLAYAKNQEAVEQESDQLVQRVMRAREVVEAMNLTSEREILHQMLETYRRLEQGEAE
ncbi:hypothetical protein [Leptolyngbya ohadii]|uniref:hypothetical protein n=1 Tax=Leptolyngbya ohadii TaxID=1962290 RepID=UPI000B59F5F9|nr:hypothetical protein [Leptolyngbya ohadii]